MTLRFGTYTEFQSELHGDHEKIVWDHIEVGVQADQLGFDVFTCLEHPWFEQFAIMTDPLQLFALMSQRTRNIRFRALCHTLTLHNPMVLAGQIALADILLNGRLEVGLGRGHAWLMEPGNIVLDESVERYPEAVEILLKSWTEDRFSFDGKYYKADNLSVVPKPVQKPHPPIIVGGVGPRVLERVLAYGDEWMPNRDRDLSSRIEELQRRAAQEGRDPIPVSYFGAEPTRGAVRALEEAGVSRVFIGLPSKGRDDVERALDEAAALI
jgi:alkanesulfonate monooxygenase SsuD/methylene tetrahydromethanopterin reductase-like flavin-dependent oxidoreductase (luciferase family)